MTIPTRPAPPPPISRSLSQASNSNGHLSSNSPVNNSVNKKKAPPRPPPPKMQESVKQPNQPATINRIANFFASSKKSISKSSEKISHVPSQVLRAPPQLPAPLISSQSHAIAEASYTVLNNDVKLINLDTSPPSSPTLIKKTNTGSDSVSMDSFCSSNSSSKNLGTASQAESGFEDDFSVSDFKVTSGMTSRSTTFSTDPFDLLDDFSPSSQAASAFTNQPSNIRNVIPSTLQQKNVSTGNVSYSVPYNTISVPNSSSAFDETLCNGKNLIKQQPISMPTIIKPAGRVAKNPLIYGTKKVSPSPLVYSNNNLLIDESFDDDEDLPSPPMPKIPPPPPPLLDEPEDDEKESHGFALYDYESDVTEDLNFKANEKIYLIKQMNDEWMYGRNKRGCEGIFPVSFINIRVPLKLEPDSGTASRSQSVSPSEKGTLIRALYTFNAETDEDLTIKENEMINVIYGITSEWLYGSNSFGAFGQFPSSFIEYVPENLQQMPK